MLPQLKDEEVKVEVRDASPSNLLVKIESFSSLAKNGISTYECRLFEAGGYKWKKVSISFNGEEDVGVWLSVAETSSLSLDWEVNALFSFFLYNHITNHYTCFRDDHWFKSFSEISGYGEFISIAELSSREFPVDDCLFIEAEVSVQALVAPIIISIPPSDLD